MILTANLRDHSVSLLMHSQSVDGILMDGSEPRVILGGALQVHLPEHIQRTLLASDTWSLRLVLNGSGNLPAGFVALKTIRFAVLHQSAGFLLEYLV